MYINVQQLDPYRFCLTFYCRVGFWVALGLNLLGCISTPRGGQALPQFEQVMPADKLKSVPPFSDDSFDKMIQFSEINKFKFPYLFDEKQEVAKKFGAVCTPDFFGYNSNLELQYRGRIKELKNLKPINSDESDLLKAMMMIVKTGKGPKNQIPSMGCNIKWFK